MALGLSPKEIVEKGEYKLLAKADHWERVSLEHIASVQNGCAFKSEYFDRDEGVPLIRIRDISRQETEHRYRSKYEGAYIVRTGDILVGMDGYFLATRWKGGKALLNQRVCRLTCVSKYFDERFFFLCLQPFLNAINAETSSVTVKHLSSRSIEAIPLPLPPLNEQHRIVAKIEELFSELDKGIESLKTARKQLKVYRQAVLKHAFEGKLTVQWREENKDKLETAEQLLVRIQKEREARYQQQLEEWETSVIARNKKGRIGKKPAKPRKFSVPDNISPSELNNLPDSPADWRWCKTGHIFDVYVGSTPSRKNSGYWGGEIPWVSSGEVAFCRINDTDEKITKQGYANASTQIHPVGTVMLAMIGEGKTRGQPAILNIEAAHNQNTAAIRVSETDCNTPLFYYYLQYQYELTRNLGSGNNQKALNKDRVSNMIVPLAPVKEQMKMAAHIEEKLSLVENIDSGILEDLGRIEVLRQSILKKAFSGQLVQQDPSDEPASILLERIQVEKEKQASKKKAPRRKAATSSTRRRRASA